MTKEQTQAIRAKLLEEREQITLTLQEHRTNRQGPEESIRDAGDRGEREIERALEHRIGLDDSHLIQKIDLALERLEDGTYGQCEICRRGHLHGTPLGQALRFPMPLLSASQRRP